MPNDAWGRPLSEDGRWFWQDGQWHAVPPAPPPPPPPATPPPYAPPAYAGPPRAARPSWFVPALVAGIIVLLAGGGGLAYTLTRHKTADPSPIPTVAPSSGPSDQPSFEPSDEPSAEPSDEPTSDPGAGSIPLGHYTCQQFVVGTGYFPMPPLELSAGTYTNGGSGSWHAEGNRMVPTSGPWADDGWSGTYSDHDATGAAVPTINVDNPDGLRIHCFK